MIIRLYAIKDVLNGFATPVMMPNDESAKRWFKDMLEENPSMRNNKEDFSIHFVGTMDVETGSIMAAQEKYLRKSLFENDERSDEDVRDSVQ